MVLRPFVSELVGDLSVADLRCHCVANCTSLVLLLGVGGMVALAGGMTDYDSERALSLSQRRQSSERCSCSNRARGSTTIGCTCSRRSSPVKPT